MKGGTVQIAWHGSEPVLSLDFHSISGVLATAGADHDIKLWSVHQNDNALPTVKFEADLSYHAKAVNVLRFSPSGQLLASGGDGGEILLWRAVENAENKPSWKVLRTLQLHLRDVLDLAWSPDSMFLMSGSVDNQCMIWDVSTGKVRQILNEHLHFVQGVAWDPAGQFLASISADRTCRIYSCQSAPTSKKQKNGLENSLYQCQQVLAKTDLLPSKSNGKTDADNSSLKAAATKQHLFHDETLPSFFRRLSWSPDGSFLVVPSGVHKTSQEAAQCNMSYIMSRKDLSRPAIQLPGPSKPVVAVRFCPIIFSLETDVPEEETSSCGFRLPYRLVFAVATLDSLFIYDTQHNSPIVIFAGLHYAAITDIAWSADAQYVAVSSQDGYCTLLAFSDDELGVRLPCSEVPPHIASYLPETLLVKGRTSSTPAPETLQKPPAQASPNSICPRPLKHRRITPSAIPVGSSPSPPKILCITSTAITVSTPPQTDNLHQIIPNTLSDSSPSTSGNYQETPASTASTSPQNNLLNDPCSTSAPLSDCNSHLVSPPLEASTASAKKRRRIIPAPIPADQASNSLQATSHEAPVESLPAPEQCKKVSTMSLSTSLPTSTVSTLVEIPSQEQHCNTVAAVTVDQLLTVPKSSPLPTKEDHKDPVLPARAQRRITPTAIPSAAPLNTQDSYDVTLASHFEASSSSGVDLSASSGSNRRESGLEFVMELNAVATAK